MFTLLQPQIQLVLQNQPQAPPRLSNALYNTIIHEKNEED
jgi:hypothetical protein